MKDTVEHFKCDCQVYFTLTIDYKAEQYFRTLPAFLRKKNATTLSMFVVNA